MASVQVPRTVPPSTAAPIDAVVCVVDAVDDRSDSPDDSDDAENIPYHARENARPFTYGNLPVGFSTSELNHVVIDEPKGRGSVVVVEEPMVVVETPRARPRPPAPQPPQNTTYPASPSPTTVRKSTRPSISPSRPVLRKTPSRQEFEEMLKERKEQALREQNSATKLAMNAAIQKDLDELHERLNRTVLFADRDKSSSSSSSAGREVITHVETIDLPDATQSHHHRPAIAAPPSSSLAGMEPAAALMVVETKQRSETPTFPVAPVHSDRCVSPYPMPRSPQAITFDDRAGQQQEVEPHLVKFAKDSSEFWYKPHMTREEAVDLLRNVPPGTFLIRNSTTYKDAYGLVLRVAKPPPGVVVNANANGDELVRHFLLEPTTRGVRLKGCSNEPIFTSLSAFVYEHSINQLALPCILTIPDRDLVHSSGDAELIAKQRQVLQQGAACNVLYLFQCDTESLTGDEAVRKAIYEMYADAKRPAPFEVHFKVSQQGITLTDNTRKVFFRRHYSPQNISHFGMDPEQRFWSVVANDEGLERAVNKSIFAFVARPLTGAKDNQCHVFCDLAATQPASAIVSFASKVLPLNKAIHKML